MPPRSNDFLPPPLAKITYGNCSLDAFWACSKLLTAKSTLNLSCRPSHTGWMHRQPYTGKYSPHYENSISTDGWIDSASASLQILTSAMLRCPRSTPPR